MALIALGVGAFVGGIANTFRQADNAETKPIEDFALGAAFGGAVCAVPMIGMVASRLFQQGMMHSTPWSRPFARRVRSSGSQMSKRPPRPVPQERTWTPNKREWEVEFLKLDPNQRDAIVRWALAEKMREIMIKNGSISPSVPLLPLPKLLQLPPPDPAAQK